MRTKNKMKDFEAKFKEWWEVVEQYFTKELEKNLAQHKANEIILRYKLKAYQKTFIDFICNSPTSTKVLSEDEETKARLSGTAQEEKMQTKKPQDLKSGIVQEAKIQTEKPQDLRRGGQEEK